MCKSVIRKCIHMVLFVHRRSSKDRVVVVGGDANNFVRNRKLAISNRTTLKYDKNFNYIFFFHCSFPCRSVRLMSTNFYRFRSSHAFFHYSVALFCNIAMLLTENCFFLRKARTNTKNENRMKLNRKRKLNVE